MTTWARARGDGASTFFERSQRWAAMTPEARLTEFSRTHDRDLCERLLREHDGIARAVARQYAPTASAPDDVFQVARIGLLAALRRFDPQRGYFAGFAFRTVRGEVQRHLRANAWPLSAQRSARDGYLRVRDETDLLTQELGRQPTPEEVAAAIGATADQVRQWQAVVHATAARPLDDSPAHAEPPSLAAEREYACVDTRLAVDSLLAGLPVHEQEIVRLRYSAGLSQTQVGELVGLTRMRVSRTLRRAVARIRESELEGVDA